MPQPFEDDYFGDVAAKWQTGVVLLLALAMGAAAVWMVAPLLAHHPQKPADAEMVNVVIATVDIPRGGIIQADSLRVEPTPKKWASANAITKIDDAVGRVASIPILTGEPVVSTKVSAKGLGGGLAALIPKGMRAFTIQTPTVAGNVAGFILPGNRVDVLLTVSEQGGRSDDRGGTMTLLQRIEILAVDQRVDRETIEKVSGATKELRSVTLLVTPDQAAQLDLGQNLGTLHLALRNPEDTDVHANARLATIAELSQRHPGLLAPEVKKPAPAAPPSTPPAAPKREPLPETIRTIRGSQEGMVQVYRDYQKSRP